MRALFGVVSLLIALAIAGLVAVKQLKAVGKAQATPGSPASAASADSPAMPQLSGSGTPSARSLELQNQVADDVAKAMKQGAEARQDASDKP